MVATDIRCVECIECQHLSPWTVQQIESELHYGHSVVLVAEHNDPSLESGVIGWCTVRAIGPEAELLKISVLNKYRRSGIGKALLSHLIAELRRKGVVNLFLEVRSQNYTALKFYKNNGFLLCGERKNYYAHPKDNALILQYNLDTCNVS